MSTTKEILLKINSDARKFDAEMQENIKTAAALKDRMAELSKENKENTEEYKNLSSKVADLNKNIEKHEKALKNLEDTNQESIKTNQDLEKTLDKNLKKQIDYKEQNHELIKIRSQLNDADDNYIENLQRITAQIEKNSEKIAEANELNVNGTLTMDYYKNKVTESFNAINIFNGGLSGFISRSQAAGGTGKLFTTSITGMTKGVVGMGKAIAANPLGLLLTILGPILQKLADFTPITQAVEKAFAALAPIMDLVNKPMQMLGEAVAWVADGISALMNAMSDSAKEASDLAKAQNTLNQEMALQEWNNEKAKQQADDLIEKSKNQTLSISERSDALLEARVLEEKNLKQQMQLAEKSIALEEQKLLQSKKIESYELEKLQNGTEEEKKALAERTKLTAEELQNLEKAYLQKMRLAEDETKAKEKQANDVRALTDSIIEQAKTENLSASERKKRIDEAIATEKKYFEDKQNQLKKQYDAELADMLFRKGLSEEEIKEITARSGIHKTLSELKVNLSKEEIKALQNLSNASAKYEREETVRMANIAEKTKTSVDTVIKKHQDLLEIWSLLNKDGKKTTDERIKFENDYAKRSQALLTEQYKNQKLTQEEYNKETIKLQQQHRDNVQQLRNDDARNALDLQKATLDYYIQSEGEKGKTLQEQLDFAKKIAEDRKKIIEDEFALSNKTKADEVNKNTELKRIDAELKKSEVESAIANFDAKLALDEQYYQERKSTETKVTAESIAQDRAYLENKMDIKMQELNAGNNFNDLELQQKYLNKEALTAAEQQYLINVQTLKNEFATANKTLDDQENTLKIQGIKDRYDQERANAVTEFDQQRIDEAERHDVVMAELNQQLADKKITQEEFDAKEADEDKTHADNKKKIDQAVFNNKLDLANQTFGSLQTLLGKESAAGKAMAVAQATIDTYKSAVSAYSAMSGIAVVGPALGAIAAAAAVAAGIQNVKKITSTKTPKAEKGALFSIGGKRHSQGGTLFTGEDGTRFEAEAGEVIGVMNRNAARHFMAFNNTFPAGGGSGVNYFASGGIVSREVAPKGLDVEELAAKIAQANASIPPPVVAVQDIITQSGSYVRVKERANF